MFARVLESHPQPLPTKTAEIGGVCGKLYLADCITWMNQRSRNSIHAVVTDPSYGLKEFNAIELQKLRRGRAGTWRNPTALDGCTRAAVPRFTDLTDKDHAEMERFFSEFAVAAFRILVPGGHVFIAANPLLSHLVYLPLLRAGFEKRGEIIRLVQTLRGGDRPKNAEREFENVPFPTSKRNRSRQ